MSWRGRVSRGEAGHSTRAQRAYLTHPCTASPRWGAPARPAPPAARAVRRRGLRPACGTFAAPRHHGDTAHVPALTPRGMRVPPPLANQVPSLFFFASRCSRPGDAAGPDAHCTARHHSRLRRCRRSATCYNTSDRTGPRATSRNGKAVVDPTEPMRHGTRTRCIVSRLTPQHPCGPLKALYDPLWKPQELADAPDDGTVQARDRASRAVAGAAAACA